MLVRYDFGQATYWARPIKLLSISGSRVGPARSEHVLECCFHYLLFQFGVWFWVVEAAV